MLHVDKADSLQSELVLITANDLNPFGIYTIVLKMHHTNGYHASYCVVQSDGSGFINLADSKPLRGTYVSADPMGLFLSLSASETVPHGGLVKVDITKPSDYSLTLLDASQNVLHQINLRKHWLHPLVERIEVNEDDLHGVLFKPSGDGRFPGILDIPGADGNLSELSAALLASEGFVVFTFAYYAYKKDLPRTIPDVDLEFFEKPVNFLQNHASCSGKLGLFGVCFGGTIAYFLATKFPQFTAVVTTNSLEAFCKGDHVMKENGKLMNAEELDIGLTRFVNTVMSQKPCFDYLIPKLTPETSIPWQKISKTTVFRIVGSLDDLVFDAPLVCNNIRKHLKRNGNSVEIELIPAGHFVRPPYFPHHSWIYKKYYDVNWGFGGESVLHSKAQEIVWKNNVDFFKKHLCPPTEPEKKVQKLITSKL